MNRSYNAPVSEYTRLATGLRCMESLNLLFQIRGRGREAKQTTLLGPGDRRDFLGGQIPGNSQVPRAPAALASDAVHFLFPQCPLLARERADEPPQIGRAHV